jgi:glycosyltransferase involved in cell wall biosynthesis
MRVLLLFEFATLNGGENSFLSLAPDLLASGVDLLAAAPQQGPLARALRALGIPLTAWDGQGSAGSLRLRRTRLRHLLRQERPDLVHANSLSMARLAGPVCRSHPLPSLGHLRDMLRPSRRTMEDLSANTRLIAVSKAAQEWYFRLGMSEDQLRVVYNGVDLVRFCPRLPSGYLHRQLGLPPTARLIASIGQLGARKGTDLLLEAFRTALPQHPDVHCLVVGERHSRKAEAVQYEHELHRRAESPPLAGRIHFLGRRGDVPKLLAELAVLVHLARQEPLGRVLLEGAAAGCCVLASQVGGTAEIFPPARAAARMVPPDEPRQAAKALEELLASKPMRQALGRAARQQAAMCFDNTQAARQLLLHYRELICPA